MPLFANMDPNTRRLLLVGAPIVAVIAFVMILKGKGKSTAAAVATPASGSLAPAPYPGSAVDTGQLASYESTITDQLASIEQALSTSSTLNGTSPTPAATPPKRPQPAAAEPGVGLFGSQELGNLQQQLAAGKIGQDEYAAVAQAYSAAGDAAQGEHFIAAAGPTGWTVTTVPAIS